ncbi:MAG: hypothetical protein KAQ68_10885 [Clostridiales bacterium]|nr:hypothetical protein [Clostridiales bacterium]
MTRFIKNVLYKIRENFKAKKYIYILTFSIFAAKSIFIRPFSLVEGVGGILIGILLIIGLFFMTIIVVLVLEKLNWTKHTSQVKKRRILYYMIPGILVSTLLWLCNWPAIVPYDSAYIWFRAVEGVYNNMHPIIYSMYVSLGKMIWDSPAIFILVQILFCSFVYSYVAYAFEKQGLHRKWCWTIAIFLSIVPVNAIHSVTWLKDISYIMSLVFISTILMECASQKKPRIKQIIALIVAGLIAMLSRHNGMLVIPLTLAFSGSIFFLMKNYKQTISFTIALLIVVVGFFGIEKVAANSLGDNYSHRSTSAEYFMLPVGQTINILVSHWYELSDRQLEDTEWFIDMGYVNLSKEKYPNRWDFNLNFNASVNVGHLATSTSRFIQFYLSLVSDFPIAAIEGYEKLTAIAWCTPDYGYTTARNKLITSYKNMKLAEEASVFPKLRDFLDSTILYPNQYTTFLWRPALYMLLTFLLLLVAYRKHGKLSLIVASPAMFNMLGYMMINPSQNVRYLYCNVSVFVIMLVYALMIPQKDSTVAEESEAITEEA